MEFYFLRYNPLSVRIHTYIPSGSVGVGKDACPPAKQGGEYFRCGYRKQARDWVSTCVTIHCLLRKTETYTSTVSWFSKGCMPTCQTGRVIFQVYIPKAGEGLGMHQVVSLTVLQSAVQKKNNLQTFVVVFLRIANCHSIKAPCESYQTLKQQSK